MPLIFAHLVSLICPYYTSPAHKVRSFSHEVPLCRKCRKIANMRNVGQVISGFTIFHGGPGCARILKITGGGLLEA